MSHVFISHASQDEAIARSLKVWMRRLLPGINCFVSSDDLAGGEVWAEVLRKRLPTSSVIVTIVTPKSLQSPWLLFESGVGFLEDKVIPLCTDGISRGELRGPFSILQARDLSPSDLPRLLRDIQQRARVAPSVNESIDAANYELIKAVDDFCTARALRELQVDSIFQPYRCATLEKTGRDLYEESRTELAEQIIRTVETEEPIHRDTALARVRAHYGLSRAGTRVRERLEDALNLAMNSGRVKWDRLRRKTPPSPPFLCVTRDGPAVPRRPSAEGSHRTIEEIPPRELEAGALFVHENLRPETRDYLVRETARQFGFSRLTRKVKDEVEEAIDRLGRLGKLPHSAW